MRLYVILALLGLLLIWCLLSSSRHRDSVRSRRRYQTLGRWLGTALRLGLFGVLFFLARRFSLFPLSSLLSWLFARGAQSGKSRYRRESSDSSGTFSMGRKEALDVLGLTDPVTEKDIKIAHRRLIARLHPDRGGSNYLAGRINQARRYLLGK